MATRRDLLALGALASLAFAWRADGADDELTRLFAELGARKERHAGFIERKFSALLKGPVESSGTLVFRAPDTLERRTVKPQRESVRVEGNTVTYEGTLRGNDQKHTFALTDAPPLAALIESLRSTLAGDLPALRRHFEVAWAPGETGRGWQITLTPRERQVREAVSSILMRGAGSELSTVEIIEAGGDLTLLNITPISTPAPTAKK